MRETKKTPLLTVLALTFVALLVTPIATTAASGLPAALSMNPETAAPGAIVEINGLDYPALTVVDVELATSEGIVPLVSTVSSDGGFFRELVALPTTLPLGAWELRATAVDGTAATVAVLSSLDAVPAAVDAAATTAAAAAGSGSDLLVLLVLAVVIGSVMAGGLVAYRLVNDADLQPGMARGDDPIWTVGGGESMLELTGIEEPTLSTAAGKP